MRIPHTSSFLLIFGAVACCSSQIVYAATTNLKGSVASRLVLKEDKCWPDSKAAEPGPTIQDDAIRFGQEATLLASLAYEYKTPGYLVNGKWEDGSWGDDGEAWTAMKARLSNVTTFSNESGSHAGAYGYVALLDGRTPVVAFAGTSDNEDAWADIRSQGTMPVRLGKGDDEQWDVDPVWYAGAGFVTYYETLRNKLEPAWAALLAEAGNNAEVLVVGHSLGGAIAHLAAVDLASKYSARVALRTMGSPRVFPWWQGGKSTQEGNYAEKFQTKMLGTGPGKISTQRWVNKGDPVPKVPPCGSGYIHVGSGGFFVEGSQDDITATIQHQDFTPPGNELKMHYLASYYWRMQQSLS